MRLTDFQDKKVRTTDGKTLGRVHEVHCDKGKVAAIMCGPGSFIEELTARQEGRRIPWESVLRIEAEAIIVTTEPLQRRKPSASRSRRGTPRTSAPRSKR